MVFSTSETARVCAEVPTALNFSRGKVDCMPRLPVSCFIITKNEGDRIARTIRSVEPWVREVVVVDSGSTDSTASICGAEGAKVVSQSWLGFGGQKRFAEEQCHYDWVLNLDADEVATATLRDAIIDLFDAGRHHLSPTACQCRSFIPARTSRGGGRAITGMSGFIMVTWSVPQLKCPRYRSD